MTHSIEEALYLGNTIVVMGSNRGEIKYQMKNPYFGELDPEHEEYLEVKHIATWKAKIK